MFFCLFFFLLEPLKIIDLPFSCSRVYSQGNEIYLAPFLGKSLIKIKSDGRMETLPFTDKENYWVRNFIATPFAFYINNGAVIEKYYKFLGFKEQIYEGGEITSFVITDAEELIIADRKNKELVFLDKEGKIKISIKNFPCLDLAYSKGISYALTPWAIKKIDKYGNTIGEIAIPEKLESLLADSVSIYLFSPKRKYFYKLNGDWKKFEIGINIQDMYLIRECILILDEYGSHLYIYCPSEF